MKEGEGEKEKKAQAFQGYLRDASCLGLRGFAVLNCKIVFIKVVYCMGLKTS